MATRGKKRSNEWRQRRKWQRHRRSRKRRQSEQIGKLAEERRRNESDGIANILMGSEPTQQQTAEGIQQSLLNSVKDACEKMNGLMQSKDVQIYNAANRSVPSSSLRAVTFSVARNVPRFFPGMPNLQKTS
ncbi:hypothetical protein niasHS_012567 [Heterodera schachtii]|uniref:Uncharacterized protein n=1 Tax=Heterodera schachtii TaxID=97005 RepID=A0ABD2ICN0_HETSC